MIINAANLQRGKAIISCDSANVCPHTIFDLRPYEIHAVFRAEHEVVIALRICVCHRFMQSLTRRGSFISDYRGLKHHGYIQTVAMRRNRTELAGFSGWLGHNRHNVLY